MDIMMGIQAENGCVLAHNLGFNRKDPFWLILWREDGIWTIYIYFYSQFNMARGSASYRIYIYYRDSLRELFFSIHLSMKTSSRMCTSLITSIFPPEIRSPWTIFSAQSRTARRSTSHLKTNLLEANSTQQSNTTK